jgi:hypothetical protein
MTRRGQSVVLISLDTLRYDYAGVRPEKVHLASYGLTDLLSTPNLDRFFSESADFVECLSPAPLVDVLRRILRRRPPVSTAGRAHGTPDPTAWRSAPVSVVDLASDPLEAQPRRLAAGKMTESQAQMLDELRGYREASRLGPLVQIGDGRGEGVLEGLEDLGYAWRG